MRFYFSTHHLRTAEYFARQVVAAEVTGSHELQRAYAVGCVYSCVGFLEAAINEVFQDAMDEHPSYVGTLESEARRNLATFWRQNEGAVRPRYVKFHKKVQVALRCVGAEPFDKNCDLNRDLVALSTLAEM